MEMENKAELRKWQEVWNTGLKKAEKTLQKNDDEYKVCHSPVVILQDQELVKSKEWLDILEETLMTKYPSEAFEYWTEKGWLAHAIPELVNLYTIPQPEKFHPEIDCGVHVMMVIDRACANDFSLRTRYLSLFHDFGKGITPAHILPSHYGHEQEGVPLVTKRLEFFSFSASEKRAIELFTKYHGVFHDIKVVKPKKMYDIIKEIGFDKDLSLAQDFCDGLVADSEGRKGYFYKMHPNAYILMHVMKEWKNAESEFDKEFTEFWNMKATKTHEKTGRNINNDLELKSQIKEKFERTFFSGVITKVIASYYPDNIIKDKQNVKRKV